MGITEVPSEIKQPVKTDHSRKNLQNHNVKNQQLHSYFLQT